MDNNQNQIDANRSVEEMSNNTYPGCGHKKSGFLKRTVDIMRYTVKIKPNPKDIEKYLIELVYEAHVDGSITFYFFEIVRESDSVDFPKAKKLHEGAAPVYAGSRSKLIYKQYSFDFPLHNIGATEVYHLEIKTQATRSISERGSTDPKDESTACVSQSTLAVFEKVKGENQVRVTNQLVWVNGVMYVCHDFVGFSNSMGIDRKDVGKYCLLCKSNENPGIHRPIGKISIINNNIGRGREGTLVFHGTYADRKVAVKRIPIVRRDAANNEIQILMECDHPNIVWLYGADDDGCFVFIALERCDYNLHQFILQFDVSDFEWYPSEQCLTILRGIVKGICHLHENRIIHGNLIPENILIHKGTSITAKVSGLGNSQRLASDQSSLTISTTDFVSYGNLLFFCITCGRHGSGVCDTELVEHLPEACDLIKHLLNQENSPTITQVRCHPFFWGPETRLSFLKVSSDIVELKEESESDDYNLDLQESMLSIKGYDNWFNQLVGPVGTDIKKRGGDKKKGLRGLLRAVRNKYNHVVESARNIREELGEVAATIDPYFREKFPSLLMDVHGVMKQHRKEGPFFKKYYEECQF